MYQYKFFYPFVLLCAVSAQAAEGVYSSTWKRQMFSSINEAFSTGASPRTLFLLALMVVAALVVLVIHELRKAHKRRSLRDTLGWDKFREKAEKLRLGSAEKDYLVEIIEAANAENADSVLNSPTVFENALEAYYSVRGLSNLGDADLALVRTLRERLGFAHFSNEVPYVSTRQFQLQNRVPCQLEDGGKGAEHRPHKWQTSIVDVNERHWAILRPEGPPVAPGTRVRLNLTRPGDAEYRVSAQVLKDIGGELQLKHTRDLSRNQLRNWVRVDVDIPAKVLRVMPGNERDRIESVMVGRIRDLSGGGLSLSLACRLEAGALIDLEFELPGHGELRGVRVCIKRVAGPLNGDESKIVHNAAFEGDYKHIQERIIHFVFEKQRQDAHMRMSL